MNSLTSYKNQVYNIGSPSPSPSSSSLENLPKVVEKDFDFSENTDNKSKTKKQTKKNSRLPRASATKRKLELQDNPDSPPKKLKMISEERFLEYMNKVDEKAAESKKETYEYFAKGFDKFENRLDNLATNTDDNITKGLSKFESRLDGLANKLDKFMSDTSEANTEIKNEFVAMKEQVSGLQSSVDSQKVKFESQFVKLEGNFNKLSDSVISASTQNIQEIKDTLVPLVKEEVIATVKKDVKAEILPPVVATWNAIQTQKVWEHEHSMLVFGFISEKPPMEAASDILTKDLKISDANMLKISVKKVSKLGKDDANKTPPPLLITFGHPSERNLVLNHSKNLQGSKITLKKSVPKNYKEAYKRFDDQAFKLRNMPGMSYQTQIVFDAHILLLRTKLRDTTESKYHYTTYWKYEPPMESENDQKSNIKVPPGTKASPPPEASVVSKANSSVFMSVKGLTPDITEDKFKQELLSYLKEEHRSHVTDFVKNKPGLAIIFCDTWQSASMISSTYTDKFMNCNVTFSLFSEKDPDQMAD